MQPVEIDREPGWHSGLSTTRRKAVLIADMRRNSTLFRGVLPSIAPPLLGGFGHIDLVHQTTDSPLATVVISAARGQVSLTESGVVRI